MTPPKIAIVVDWLTDFGGAERVILAMHEAFPDAPIYTSVYEPKPELAEALKGADIRTTNLQNLPKKLRRVHKFLPMLRVRAFRQLDLSEFDIILSSSSAEAKQVRKTRPGQVHICYCHTPIRYFWSHYNEYKKDPGFGKLNILVRLAMPFIVPPLKRADYDAAQGVDMFIANSTEVQKRIRQYYDKPSTIIHPPVDVGRFDPAKVRGDYYVALGRQVPYKRIDLAVAAATRLGVKLKVFGNGSEHDRLVKMAGSTVEFHTDRFGDASDTAVEIALNSAKGYIFPAEEDFGIVQVEALAAGAPVIGFARGGTVDIIDNGVSGVLFTEQTVDSVSLAVQKAESIDFMPATLQRKAKRFDTSLFITKIRKVVGDKLPR
ncbi:glycosyl transferase family 1 [Candidatus Saccharibacteria bacterium RIFCSPHIGHO2_01_FULL_45_15]|nr:MAG: glycosyl transferase family 1 [Candidatus Saccharibacteria bacterium RIFCSPHIGHO2_01_FULL_45_15]OGL27127.1 MAG: glycosyl transferase family 1 [Candidatus Saccharibacteria bacterium RIFCSPHIGHO2_02_FULL_46_12]OGL31544.1 MAG: glycosyl transferase family 1 [Candidatus Saccharibacteria bacterium RIFCSPHIGHO2_12_FULL_44_22]